jgi:Transmembrane family, TMEM144 of transporters
VPHWRLLFPLCVKASSMIVLVSFTWGIFVFKEPIHSVAFACAAIFFMILGLFGMSYYSTSAVSPHRNDDVEMSMPLHRPSKGSPHVDGYVNWDTEHANGGDAQLPSGLDYDEVYDPSSKSLRYVDIYGIPVSKRHLGMLAAAFCGLWGGSIMAPMKFCKADTKGTHYLLSFAIGAAIVNVSLWLLRYVYNVAQCRSFRDAYHGLPSFHFRKMWLMGGTAGILWSIGNFFSLISVFYLGEGVGYPLVQTSILISGLWGLLYFKEVQGIDRIAKWLCSSLLTVFGILLLSYEHHAK